MPLGAFISTQPTEKRPQTSPCSEQETLENLYIKDNSRYFQTALLPAPAGPASQRGSQGMGRPRHWSQLLPLGPAPRSHHGLPQRFLPLCAERILGKSKPPTKVTLALVWERLRAGAGQPQPTVDQPPPPSKC